MANWTFRAIEDLRDLIKLQNSVMTIPEEIKLLESRQTSLRSALSGSVPVDGGTSKAEDAWIQNIDERGRLAENYRVAKMRAGRIEKALDTLPEDEQLVLQRFYINRERGYIDRLCEELFCEQANIYKIKTRALRNFTVAQFGVIDL